MFRVSKLSVGLTVVALVSAAAAATAGAGASHGTRDARGGQIALVMGLGRCDGLGTCNSAVQTVFSRGGGKRRLRCSSGRRRRCHDGYVAYSPGGRRLATATDSQEPNTIVVRAPRGRVFTRTRFRRAITDFDWAPDGRRFAVNASGAIWLVDRATGRSRYYRRTGGIDVSWSRQGRLAWTDDRTGSLWTTDRRLRGVRRYRAAVGTGIAWAPAGRRLALQTLDGTVVINEDGTGRRVITQRCTASYGSPAPSTPLAWSPSGREIACGTDDGKLIAIDVRTRKVRRIARQVFPFNLAWQPKPRSRR